MNSAKRTLALVRMCTKRHSSQTATQPSAYFDSLKKTQAKFQLDDGLPVFLKGGATDKILYQITSVLCVVAAGMMGKLFWDLAVPQK